MKKMYEPIYKKTPFLNTILIFLLHAFRPLLGTVSCKFPLSCGNYAIVQLQEKPLHKALLFIVKRLLSCNPFNRS